MITPERYQQITGDHTSADAEVNRCIADAVAELEEYLDRPLAEAERTESMRPDRHGNLWPRATPIIEAEGYEIDGLALVGSSPFGPGWDFLDPSTGVEVTYTGGWADQTAEDFDAEADNQLPFCIVRDLAWAAYRLARPSLAAQATTVPTGANSVRLGDAAVTFGPGGASATGDSRGWWSPRTRGYRYAPVHAGPTIHRVGI